MTGKMDSDNKGQKNLDTAVEHLFKVQCKGRGVRQQPALVQPISVDVTISQISNAELSLSSNCQYLGKEGDDSGRCLAGSQAQSNYTGWCPYCDSLPDSRDYLLQRKSGIRRKD